MVCKGKIIKMNYPEVYGPNCLRCDWYLFRMLCVTLIKTWRGGRLKAPPKTRPWGGKLVIRGVRGDCDVECSWKDRNSEPGLHCTLTKEPRGLQSHITLLTGKKPVRYKPYLLFLQNDDIICFVLNTIFNKYTLGNYKKSLAKIIIKSSLAKNS